MSYTVMLQLHSQVCQWKKACAVVISSQAMICAYYCRHSRGCMMSSPISLNFKGLRPNEMTLSLKCSCRCSFLASLLPSRKVPACNQLSHANAQEHMRLSSAESVFCRFPTANCGWCTHFLDNKPAVQIGQTGQGCNAECSPCHDLQVYGVHTASGTAIMSTLTAEEVPVTACMQAYNTSKP